MRGFFAFGVGAEFSRELAKIVPVDPGLKPLLPADYHLTIKFLSEFSSSVFIEALPELCALGPAPKESLRAGKIAIWPTVLALECEPSKELIAWHKYVNALLERKGFLKERHPRFHPHITLARKKLGVKLPEVEAQLKELAHKFEGQPVPISPPMLWRSQAEDTGRRHRELLSPLFSRQY